MPLCCKSSKRVQGGEPNTLTIRRIPRVQPTRASDSFACGCEPEASVSAVVFHHPDCAYFRADEGETVLSV